VVVIGLHLAVIVSVTVFVHPLPWTDTVVVIGLHLAVIVSVTVFVHPLPWTDTVVVIGLHLAVIVLVCVTVSGQPFAVIVVVTGVHFSTDVIVFVFQPQAVDSFHTVLTAVQGAVIVIVSVFQPHFSLYSVEVIHFGTYLVVYTVSISVIVTNSFLNLTTVVGTTSILVETSVTVLQVLGYLVFQPQDVFHSVTWPPRSTTAAEAAAVKVRMLRKCIVKSTAV